MIKKIFYISGIILFFGIISVMALDVSLPYHPLQQIENISGTENSVDFNENGIIDNSDDVSCVGCVIPGEINFNFAGSTAKGGAALNVPWTGITGMPAGFADGVDNQSSGSSYWTASGNNIYSSNTGNVGIGITSPTSYKLQVGGNGIQATAFYYSSDINLKENIYTISNPLWKIQQLEGVSFNWKDSGKASIGLIAQDVEQIIPEIVSTDDSGLKSIEYANLVALLIEAIKKQQEQIDSLEKQIQELKSEDF